MSSAAWSFADMQVFSPARTKSGGAIAGRHSSSPNVGGTGIQHGGEGPTKTFTDGIDLKAAEQDLTDQGGGPDAGTKAPDAGTKAPDAGTKAPDAGTKGPDAGAPAPATATAVTFATVNASTTPASMSARIPPRIDQSVAVTLTGSSSVDISVDGASATNGTATLDGAATKTLSASGAVALRGTTQTAAGSAGMLRLVAKAGATVVGTSNAFTICAIPTTVSIVLANLITGTERGIAVTTSNDSDSGQVPDLDKVQMSEKVQYVNGLGCFAGIVSGNNSGFLPANASPHGVDSHGTPIALLTSAGSIDSKQAFVFNDLRSGAANIPVTNSGFNIHREVTAAAGGAGTGFSITTSKAGLATTVNGSSVQAGSGSATGTQAV
ncbi:hypothetical protein [Granulicella sp. dw_53]|uniref:hypothetical protein n=1 Tax=Granulicella sp. dw_53 TaxID=2719792 RepID=UPI001BD30D8F|nr:hypothetical protein [Granulicella sp. dw_53]